MYDPDIRIRHGNFLPHWTKDGGIYHVRIRLADSLPQQKLDEWKHEREDLVRRASKDKRKLTRAEQERLDFLFSDKVEKFLDSGYGACWLKIDEIAEIVADTLWKFNEDSYKLFAWCIMPNHVHIILQQLTKELQKIMHSLKWYTGLHSNKILGRSGEFWQREYFDHLIRNQESLERAVEYVWSNPDKAGLKDWKWRWRADKHVQETLIKC